MNSVPVTLAFDTSNYTTSCAWFDGIRGENMGRPLDVPRGEIGLRQSDAVFLHVKNLGGVYSGMNLPDVAEISAVGASVKPREEEGSYMPCFLVGRTQGEVLAAALKIPFYEFSHQQGHIAAALWSAGRMDLVKKPFLAWHLSGGTTELLYVKPLDKAFTCRVIGGTSDLSAGQLIDRVGRSLGLSFPSGGEMDELALLKEGHVDVSVSVRGLDFSLSGLQNKAERMIAEEKAREAVSAFVLKSIASSVLCATENAFDEYGDIPVVFSGGVSGSRVVEGMFPFGIFAGKGLSADNAMGIAVLTHMAGERDY